MGLRSRRSGRTALSLAVLRARVHLDALIADPAAYVSALRWRVLGKKLRARHRFAALMGESPRAYALWIATREPDILEEVRAVEWSASDGVGDPLVVVVDCRASVTGLADTLDSIARQSTGTPTVLLLGGSQPVSPVCEALPDLPTLTARLSAIAPPGSDGTVWVMPVAAGDTLSPLAVAAYARARRDAPDATLFYADDDLLDGAGNRHDPLFKPQWNSELFRHHDYVSGACLFACDPRRISGESPLAVRPLDHGIPVHVPLVLHHRRDRPRPVVPAMPALPYDLPHVSVVIPTRNGADLLRTCMAGLAQTDYPSFDVTIIDNDSDDPEALALLADLAKRGTRIVPWPGAFNYAAMHNAVVPQLAGPLVCLLNNDIEMTAPDWLGIMALQTLREDVGAVGARLLYPDGSIQHAGIVIGVGGGAGHAHRFAPGDAPGYFARALLPQYVSAVTAACLVLRKDRFAAVGGFDADNFTVAFNDVDLCLKLNARGWQSFYEPRACLVHHESKSRGLDTAGPKKVRFDRELEALKRIWGTDKAHDPYHHPELSQFGERFVVKL